MYNKLTMSEQTPDQFNVVSWNVLYDKGREESGIVSPQRDRVASQAKALMELGIDLDVVMLHEVWGDNGNQIAALTGNEPGIWQHHNRKNEHIGTFGRRVEAADFHDIGHKKKAVVTYVGGLAVFGLHLVARPKRYFDRVEQSVALCELVDKENEAIIAADFNGPWFEAARRMLARRGFRSAFAEADTRERMIYPTEKYRDIMLTPWQQRLLGNRTSIDDILVRGLDVADAGVFVGDSDHMGGWVTIAA